MEKFLLSPTRFAPRLTLGSRHSLPFKAAAWVASWHVLPMASFLPPPFFFSALNLYYFPKSHVNVCASIQGGGHHRTGKAAWDYSFGCNISLQVTGEGWPQTDTTGSHFRLLRARPVFHLLSVTQHAPSSPSRTYMPDAAGWPEL